MLHQSELDIPHRLLLLAGMLDSAYRLDAWAFLEDGKRVCFSDHEDEYWMLLNINGCMDYVRQHVMRNLVPHVLSDKLGLMWLAEAAPEVNEGEQHYFVVLGPFFISSLSPKSFETTLRGMNLSPSLTRQIMEVFQTIPVVNMTSIQRLVAMLHYCMTNQSLDGVDVHYQDGSLRQRDDPFPKQEEPDLATETARTMELTIRQAIREGDTNLGGIFAGPARVIQPIGYHTGIPLRDERNIVIVNTALSSRAAVEGGLSPKIAQQMEEYYVRQAELAQGISQLANLNLEMMQDFAENVRRCRSGAELSAGIQEAMVFVQANLCQPFTLKDLARSVGYTEYYLTRKFKKETGENLTDYIRRVRLERGKILLRTTDQSIQAISEQLQFGTRNYFTKVFREATGQTPAQYRQRRKET